MQDQFSIIRKAQQRFQQNPTPIQVDSATGLLLKREDLSVVGSHKFRPMAWEMSRMAAKSKYKISKSKADFGNNRLLPVIVPTSGNAGIAATIIGKEYGIEAWCFVSPLVDRAKAAQIAKHGGRLLVSERSVRYSGFVHKTMGIPRLRQSVDDEAVVGYWTLALELTEQVPDADAIFLFATSGTTAVGIFEGYRLLGKKCPEMHVVWNRGLYADTGADGTRMLNDQVSSDAGHGGLSKSRRDKDVESVVMVSGGAFHFATHVDDIAPDTSPEGKACIAEATRYQAEFPDRKVVVICSGRAWPDAKVDPVSERCEEVFGGLPKGSVSCYT